MANMQESLLQPDDKDVTKPEVITMFDTIDDEKKEREDDMINNSTITSSLSQSTMNGNNNDDINMSNNISFNPYASTSSRENARKRVDTTERFKMNHSELRKLAFQNTESIERRDKFIKENAERDMQLNEMQEDDHYMITNDNVSEIDLKGDSSHFYAFRMTIDDTNTQKAKKRIPIALSWRNIMIIFLHFI